MLERDEDKEKLILLCKRLLLFVNMVSGKPYYIVQPGLSIIRDNSEIINRLNLFEE